jgi:hypothetical protein
MPTKSTQETRPLVVSPLYQTILIIISFTCLSLAFYKQFNIFHFLDARPNIRTVTPQIYAESGGFASVIRVGLEIGDFEVFNMTENKFTFNGIVWFQFTPGIISLDTLEQFRFSRGEVLKRSEPDIQLIDDKILVRYLVKVQFTAPLDHSFFPLDDHRVYLMLAHPFIAIGEIIFDASISDFITKKNVADVGWNEVNQQVEPGFSQAKISENDPRTTRNYPAVLFAIDYERYGIRHFLTIILPLLLIFYISFFSLCIKESNISLAIVAVTALISYRFVIDRMSPDVGYFMFSDYYFFIFLGGVLAVFLLNMINEYSTLLTTLHLKIAIACIHLVVVAFVAYLFLY